ncbi:MULTISPECIES: hypothetical protein [Halorhodospira]|uniref:hypothetical protein n=1 Tax=Halorhodospira TaxID=85108 RepID=UPI0019118158|nr:MULTISPECIES: hypothetical protein [Halorhodospira]MCG5539536.1 hypothetical protein [Halorhodospira sp. 9622]
MARANSSLSVGTRYDHHSRRVRRVYRELPPRATALLGRWMVEAFGAAGVQLHDKRVELLSRERETALALNNAIKELS